MDLSSAKVVARGMTLLGALVAAVSVSCGVPPEVVQLRQSVSSLAAQRTKDQEEVSRLGTELRRAQVEIDWLTDQTPACKYREYGQRLKESCEQGRCDPSSTNSALSKLKELPGSYVVLRLKPELGAEGLTRGHLDQIMELLISRTARPTTRLLLLVMPPGNNPKDPQGLAQQASQIATDLRESIRQKVGPSRGFGWATPTVVGCTKETKAIFHQFATLYQAQLIARKVTPEKEPKPEDSLMVILFRLDCFASNYATP